jgi:hypothetical protein
MRSAGPLLAAVVALAAPAAVADGDEIAAILEDRQAMVRLMDRFCRAAEDYRDCALEAVHASLAFDEEVERLFAAPMAGPVYARRVLDTLSCAEAAGVPRTLDLPLMARCLGTIP